MKTPDKPQKNLTQNPARALLVSISAGCLTVVVAGLAIGAGVLLDLRHDSLPHWTLIFLLGSAPLTLGGVYLLVQRALTRGKSSSGDDEGKGDNEQAD